MIGTLIGALAILAMGSPSDAQAILNTIPAVEVADPRPAAPVKVRTESLGVKTSAECAFVADVASGAVLYAKDPHRVVPIASLTKLVTAMTFLDMHPDFSKKIVVTEEDQDPETRRVFQTGDVLTYEDVFRSMLVGSVNTSANIIAHTTLGREKFVAAMNEKVRKLGLKSPHFEDPSGLNPENKANAADVAAILSDALAYPEIRNITEKPQIVVHGQIKDYTINSTNMLMNSYLNHEPYKIVAGKTGTLPEIGFNMAQVTRNADGHEVVAVELGSDNTFSRFQDIKSLTTWAFDTYQWQ